MSTYKTQGIIISTRDTGETDRFYSVLLKDRGIASYKAKGVRKIKSRLSGHLESFSEVNFYIAKGKTTDIVAGASPMNRHAYINRDLVTISAAQSIASLLIRIVKTTTDPDIYNSTSVALGLINSSDNVITIVIVYYWRVLALSGFKPELYLCADCGKRLTGEVIRMDVIKGSVLCGNESKTGFRVSVNDVKALRIATERDISESMRFDLTKNIQVLYVLLVGYLEHQIGFMPKALRFLKEQYEYEEIK